MGMGKKIASTLLFAASYMVVKLRHQLQLGLFKYNLYYVKCVYVESISKPPII